jgi:hypothetical protein
MYFKNNKEWIEFTGKPNALKKSMILQNPIGYYRLVIQSPIKNLEDSGAYIINLLNKELDYFINNAIFNYKDLKKMSEITRQTLNCYLNFLEKEYDKDISDNEFDIFNSFKFKLSDLMY